MKKCIITIYLLLAGLTISAAEYHVAKTGKDTNPGTAASPFLTIQRAADVAQPGDVITVHAGIYREERNLKDTHF
jgi:alpha-N-arabinofuranosidase